ncbi:RNA SPLICING PROTEIN MRS2 MITOCHONDRIAL, partial [Salix purpurea]
MRSRPRTPPLSKPEDDKDPMTRPDPPTTSLNVRFPSSRKNGTGVRPSLLLDSTGQVQAIFTAQKVLLLNSRDPSVTPFMEELQWGLMFHHHVTKAQFESKGWSPEKFREGFSHYQDCNKGAKQGLENREGSKVLPFEFVALEACLEAACSCLESEVKYMQFLGGYVFLQNELNILNREADP